MSGGDQTIEEWRRAIDEVRRGDAGAITLTGIGDKLVDEVKRLQRFETVCDTLARWMDERGLESLTTERDLISYVAGLQRRVKRLAIELNRIEHLAAADQLEGTPEKILADIGYVARNAVKERDDG